MRPAPANTGIVVTDGEAGEPDLIGRPADGDHDNDDDCGKDGDDGDDEVLTAEPVASDLGTVRVVKRVAVTRAVDVESVFSLSPPVGKGGLAPLPDSIGAGGEEAEVDGPTSAPSVMGHTVVLTAIVSVTTWPILPGQSVTVTGQLVTV